MHVLFMNYDTTLSRQLYRIVYNSVFKFTVNKVGTYAVRVTNLKYNCNRTTNII